MSIILGSAYGKIGLDTSGIVTGVQQAVNAIKNFKSTMELAGGGLNTLKNNLNTAKTAVSEARAELDKLKASGAAKAEIEAAAESLKKLESNAVSAANAVGKAESQMKQLGDTGKMVGSAMTQAGQALTLALTVPLLAAAAASTKIATDFSASMNILKGASNASAEELEKLRQKAIDLGADLSLPGTSASDAAEAMAELAKAGLNVNDVLAASKGVLQLSAAGQISNAEAATVAANALNMFNLDAAETVRVADLLAASANASSADVHQMAESLQMSGSVAASAGIKIEDLIAAISLMANAGIQGSDAGTSIKQMLLSLEAPTDKASDLMRGMGIQIYDASGKMKTMREIIQVFSEKLGGLTQQQRNQALATIFGSDAVRAANIVLMGGVDAYDQMSASVTKNGAAAKMAGTMMEGLSGAFENVKSSAETAGLAGFEPFTGSVIGVLNAVSQLLSTFASLPAPIRASIVVFLGILAALGPVLAVLGQLVVSISSVAAAWPTITALLPGLTVGLSGAGTALVGFADAAIAMTAAIPGLVAGAFTAIGTAITGTILPAIAAVGAALLPIIAVVALVALAFGLLYFAWTTDFLGFQTTLRQLGFIIQFYIGQGIDAAKIKMTELGPAVNQWGSQFLTTLQQIDFIVNFYTGQAMRGAVQAVVNAGPPIQKAWQSMITGIQTAWTNFTTMLQNVWNQVWTSIINYLSSAASQVLNYISNVRNSILAYFQIDWSQIGSNIINGIISGIANGVGALVEAVRAAAMAALEAAKSALGIASPSTKFAYLGEMSGVGYMRGFAKNMDPSTVARGMAKVAQPSTGGASYQQVNHFANGLTLRDAQRMMDERDQQLMNTFNLAFGS